MTKGHIDRHREPEQLRDILKRILDGWSCKILCVQCGLYHIIRYGGDNMCDFDDFEDFEDDGFMDDTEDGLSGDEQESDGFGAEDAFWAGSIVGNAYEEGLNERKRRELLRKRRTRRDPTSGGNPLMFH